ncbi:MAG TPA: hypothetical protein PLO62_00435 [Candidatus Hydrogenedentes bacterium]|nr:hypothetical protein [Candidatus Hydrogenedentota bacterium]
MIAAAQPGGFSLLLRRLRVWKCLAGMPGVGVGAVLRRACLFFRRISWPGTGPGSSRLGGWQGF